MAPAQRKVTVLHCRGPTRGAAAGRTALAPPFGRRSSGRSRPPRATRTENSSGPTGRTDGSGSELERTVCFEQRPKSERSERNGTHRVRSGHGWKRPCRGTGAFINKRSSDSTRVRYCNASLVYQREALFSTYCLFIKERLYFQCIDCVERLSHAEINTRQVVQKPGRAFIH